jgi:hypothetical protein
VDGDAWEPSSKYRNKGLLSNVLEVKTTLNEPFGRVSDGFTRILGPLCKVDTFRVPHGHLGNLLEELEDPPLSELWVELEGHGFRLDHEISWDEYSETYYTGLDNCEICVMPIRLLFNEHRPEKQRDGEIVYEEVSHYEYAEAQVSDTEISFSKAYSVETSNSGSDNDRPILTEGGFITVAQPQEQEQPHRNEASGGMQEIELSRSTTESDEDEGEPSHDVFNIHALMLQPTGERGQYRRVGLFTAEDQSSEILLKAFQTQQVDEKFYEDYHEHNHGYIITII